MRVFVSGAASHLAGALLPTLLEDSRITHVTGLDRAPIAFSHPRFTPLRGDLLAGDLRPLLARNDAVIHLAFVVLAKNLGRERKNRELMRRHNLEGTRRLCEAAQAAGVRKLVYTSSVAVYGAWPDNPLLIPEEWPLRPTPGFAYGEDKAAVEAYLDELEALAPDFEVTRLRIHAILGPHAQDLLKRIARSRFYLQTPDPQPLVQCVHEDDVVQAILLSLFAAETGAFNIAAPEPLSFRTIVLRGGRFGLPLPYALAEKAQRLFWHFSGAAGDPGWLAGLRHNLLVDTGKAQRVLAWRPRFTVAACIDKVAGFGRKPSKA